MHCRVSRAAVPHRLRGSSTATTKLRINYSTPKLDQEIEPNIKSGSPFGGEKVRSAASSDSMTRYAAVLFHVYPSLEKGTGGRSYST